MAHAYTPGLQIKVSTRYRATRQLPIPGQVLVQTGDAVQADQVVARTEQPGHVYPLNLANAIGVQPGDIPKALLHEQGGQVSQGERLAQSPGIFGFFKQSIDSPADGTIETVSSVTGQVILRGPPVPVEVNAFVSGVVQEVIPSQGVVVETTAAFLQGIFGIGGEQQGTLRVVARNPDQNLTPDLLSSDLQGAIVVGGGRVSGEAVARSKELGIRAIISGGIDDQDLKEILGYDLGVAVTGSEQLGLSLIITEGFGQIAMADRTFELLRSLDGRAASVNGATQIRAGVLRPEIVVPLPEAESPSDAAARVGGGVLKVGSRVRLIRDPYFGKLGEVSALLTEPQVLASGSRARVLEVNCNGERIIVPRANVELVGD